MKRQEILTKKVEINNMNYMEILEPKNYMEILVPKRRGTEI